MKAKKTSSNRRR